MTLKRLPDWPERLAGELTLWRKRSYELGTNDCAHFVVACCIAVTGVDVGERWRGTYSGPADVARLFAEIGVRDLAGWADHVIAIRRHIAVARRGDWMLTPPADEPCLGICDGARSFFLTPGGLTTRPTMDCSVCWQIGE